MSDDATFLAAAILLAQALGNSSREVLPAEVEIAVTNAERLREELDNRYYKKRAGKKFDRPKRQDDEPVPGK